MSSNILRAKFSNNRRCSKFQSSNSIINSGDPDTEGNSRRNREAIKIDIRRGRRNAQRNGRILVNLTIDVRRKF